MSKNDPTGYNSALNGADWSRFKTKMFYMYEKKTGRGIIASLMAPVKLFTNLCVCEFFHRILP